MKIKLYGLLCSLFLFVGCVTPLYTVLQEGEQGEAPPSVPPPPLISAAQIASPSGDTTRVTVTPDAIYDIAVATAGEGAVEVEDDAYGAGWAADATHSPSQKAMYAYLIQIDTDADGDVDNIDAAALAAAETDPVVGAITGIVKADGAGTIAAAVAGTDYLATDGDGSGLSGVLLSAGTDIIKDTHIDWGTGATQVSGADIPLDTSNFAGNLDGDDTTVQAALDTLDDIALGGSDAFTVKVDAAATAGYIGAASNEGTIRTDGTVVTKTDGGDFVTIGVHGYLADIAGITAEQGDIIYFDGTDWVKLVHGVSGQVLVSGGDSANVSWGDVGTGDITAVGDTASGAAFTEAATSNVLYFEGTTDNTSEIALTGRNPSGDVVVYLPAEAGDLVLGPQAFGTDNRLIKTDGTGVKTQITGITIADTTDSVSGITDLAITGDLTVGGDDITMATNTSGAVLVADGTNFNPVVMSGAVSIGTTGTTAIAADAVNATHLDLGTGENQINVATIVNANDIDTTHIDWGSGENQVDLDEVPDGTTYQRVLATDVDAAGHVNVLQDIDGTGAITVTGPTATRAITIDDAAQELAARNRANTFTENNTFGNADTDTLTIRSLLAGGNSRGLWIAASAPTPSYATTPDDLYVGGTIEVVGTVYANSFNATGTGSSYIQLNNNSGGYAPSASEYSMYFETDGTPVFRYSLDGTEKTVANLEDTQTFSGNKTFTGTTAVQNTLTLSRGASAAQLILREASGGGTETFTLQTPNITTGYALTVPAAQGANGETLLNNGSGVLSWGTPTASAAGSDTEVQFNDGGSSVGAEPNLTFNKTTAALTIGANATGGSIILYNELGGTDYSLTLSPNATQNANATITLPAATGTLSTLGANSFAGAQTPSVADTYALGSATLEWSDLFLGDGAVINLGVDQDVTLTHVADTGVRLNTTMALQFRDAAISINSGADGYLDLTADTGIDLTVSDEDLRFTDGGENLINVTSNTGVATVDFGTINLATDGLDLSEGDITNVGNIALDSISADGTNVLFGSAAATQLQFRDTAVYIASLNDGYLDLEADTGIRFNGPVTFANEGAITLPNDTVTMAMLDDDGNFTDWTGNWTFATGTFTLSNGATLGGTLNLGAAALIDATGAVDMDYGSEDVTDHTFTSDGGVVVIDGGIVIPDAGNIGSASDTDAIAIASTGVVTFSQVPVLPANSIDSDHYVDGSIDTAHLASDIAISTTGTIAGKIPAVAGGASDISLSVAQVSGTIISNTGQGPANRNHTLPTAAAGLSFIGVVGEAQAANYYRFTRGGTDTMCLDGTCSKTYVSIAAPSLGAQVACYTLQMASNGMNAVAGLAIGTTNTAVSSDAFTYDIANIGYSKAAVDAGTAPGNDVIPEGTFGAVAFDIGTDGTIDAIEATDNATGYASAALAIAGLPAAAASHLRIGTVTASSSSGAFTFGTTALDAANTTVAYTDTAVYTKPYVWQCTTGNGTWVTD